MATECASAGYVLHARRYRENSRILDIFTENHGRVALLVRVSQKHSGGTLGKLQPFHENLYRWRGRGELQTAVGIDELEAVRLEGLASLCGLYCNELLLKLMAKAQAYPEVYQAYRATLVGLASESPPGPWLRRFETELLAALGYGLNLDTDGADGTDLASVDRYFFHPEHGVSTRRIEADAIDVGAAALHAIRDRRFDESGLAREIRQVLSAAINHLLNGRPLASKLLLQSLERKRP
ncbi:MAG: DNA repair protein RecO [Thiotrichales bacterium]